MSIHREGHDLSKVLYQRGIQRLRRCEKIEQMVQTERTGGLEKLWSATFGN